VLDWLELKNVILSDLSKVVDSDRLISTFKYNLETTNIKELINYTASYPLAYFSDKEKKNRYLGVGKIKLANNIQDFNKYLELVENYPELYLMGGQRFDQDKEISPEWTSFNDYFYFIPQILFIDNSKSITISINIDHSKNMSQQILEIEKGLSFTNNSRIMASNPVTSSEEFPELDTWNKNVNKCLFQIQENILQKAVLARKKIIQFESELNIKDYFLNMTKSNPNSFQALLQVDPNSAFISVSPERLFSIEKSYLITESIAGTTPRGTDQPRDKDLENKLLNSTKEINEQKIVTQLLSQKLHELSEKVEVLKDKQVLKLKYIQHLHTTFKAKIKKNITITEIINKLHPTPAVGGGPTKQALKFIRDHEQFDRGFYAAPFGVIGKDKSDLAVGIRSILIKQKTAHIYGGAGIVQGSEGKKEWIETQNKMKNFLENYHING